MALKVDPVLLEVLRNAFQSITEEMSGALIRSAYSTNIKDRRDCSCALYTKEGDLVAQAENIPLHLGLMPNVVKAVLKVYPIDHLEKGDGVIINDPYISGSHLPDLTLMSPVFVEDNLVALVANMAHHVDVGGMAPGSMATKATEIFQEGFRIPPVKIQKKGKLDEEILRIIETNTRTSYITSGDIKAQTAANNVGIRRIIELINERGMEVVLRYFTEVMDYSERRMKESIKKIPDGEYFFEDYLEGDGITDDLIKIKAVIRVEDEYIEVDFTGTDNQVKGPVNCTRAVTHACVYFAIKSIVDPGVPPNEGAYKPIKIVTPEGTLVNPKPPAPVAHANINTSQRIVDVILGALKNCVPERITAASTGSMSILTMGGLNPKTDSYYSYVETYGGGQGAMYNQDGMDGVHTNMTNTRNAPTEVIESTYPLLVNRYALVPGSCGAGEFRGGLGMTREITVRNHEATFSLSMERRELRPWGIFGGKSGGSSKSMITTSEGEVKKLSSKTTGELKPGDKLTLVTAGGGGAGDPLKRDVQKVKQDVIQKFISLEDAKKVYGVILDPETLEVMTKKTKQLRRKLHESENA